MLVRRPDGAPDALGRAVVTALAPAAPTPVDVALARLERLVSPWSGAVRDAYEILAAPDDARLPRFAAILPDTQPLLGFLPGHLEETSGGCADSRDRARAAAIGEAAERFAASFVPDAELVLATARELGPRAVEPERFALFAPEQHERDDFPFAPFTADTVVRWAPAFSLPAGAPALLPAQLVYLHWSSAPAPEAPIGYATSSGLACGPTLVESLLAGLYELIERDGFMLAWTHRLSLPLLDWSTEPELLAWEARYLAPAGARHDVVDLSCFLGVPAALAVVQGAGHGQPAWAVGAGCAATMTEAWKKALAEAYSVRSWARALLAESPGRRFARPPEIASFADHVHFHALAENRSACAFLTASHDRRPLAEAAPVEGERPFDRISALCARLAEQGCGVWAVDVTTPDVRSAGLRVTKTIVPELCPLDVRHDARFLGGTRLRTLPHRLGLTGAPPAWEELNPDPHPFP